jgi:gliding motility-associated-like protein
MKHKYIILICLLICQIQHINAQVQSYFLHNQNQIFTTVNNLNYNFTTLNSYRFPPHVELTRDGNKLVACAARKGIGKAIFVYSFDGFSFNLMNQPLIIKDTMPTTFNIDVTDDGNTIIASGTDTTFIFSNVGGVYQKSNLSFPQKLLRGMISGDGKIIVGKNTDQNNLLVYTFNGFNLNLVQTLTINNKSIRAIDFSQNGKTLAMAYIDTTSADYGLMVYTFNGIGYDIATSLNNGINYSENYENQISITDNGNVIASADYELNTISLYSFAGNNLTVNPIIDNSFVNGVPNAHLKISGDGSTLVSSYHFLQIPAIYGAIYSLSGLNYSLIQSQIPRNSVSTIPQDLVMSSNGKVLVTGSYYPYYDIPPLSNLQSIHFRPSVINVFNLTPLLTANNLSFVNTCSGNICGQQVLSITSNLYNYSVSGLPSWLTSNTLTGSWNQNITVTALPNNTSSSRTAIITLTGISYGYTNTFTVFQERPLDVSFSANTVCSGVAHTFEANKTLFGGTFAYYQWQTPIGVYTTTSEVFSEPVTSEAVTSYQVTLTGYNTDGGSGVAVGTAYVLPPTQLRSLTPSATVCSGMAQTFTASATGTSISYQWAVNSNQLPVSSEQLSVNSYLTTSLAGVYGLTVSGSCGTVTTSTGLTVNSNPPFSLGADSQELWLGERISLSPKPYNNSSIALWNTGETSTILVVDKAGTYTLTLMAAGCPNQTKSISIYTLDCNVYIPPFITPNGDGQNDTWDLTNLYRYPQAQVKVLNRWGELVKTLQSDSPPWDGNVGNSLKEEVFYYLLDLGNGQPVRKGSLSVLRQ